MDGLNIHGTTPAQRAAKPKAPAFLIEREPWATGFFRRVKEFLTENPLRVPEAKGPLPLVPKEFGSSFSENLREFFKPVPRSLQGPVHSRMLVEEKPGSRVFWENLRDLIAPPKLPPLKVTSKPVKVKDIWSKDKAFGPSQAIALAVHIGITLLILFPLYKFATKAAQTPVTSNQLVTPLDISDYAMKL